jgi:hypothetical protein
MERNLVSDLAQPRVFRIADEIEAVMLFLPGRPMGDDAGYG